MEVWQRAVGWPQGWEVALCRRLYYSSLGFCMAGSAWLSSPCLISRRLLSAHPSVDKWPAGWLLVTLPGGGGWSSQTCVWQFGLEPEVGGLPMEEARPSITPGALNPKPVCMTFH